MKYVVVAFNYFLRAPVGVFGPFDTKDEATAWLNQKDQFLSDKEVMGAHALQAPSAAFGGR